MSSPARSSRWIWLVKLESRHGDTDSSPELPKEIFRLVKRVSLSAALKLLESETKPSAIFLEGHPGIAMQRAIGQINEREPLLPIFVISHWQNVPAMRAWFSRQFVEMVRATPATHKESPNAYQLSARELEILRLMVKGLIKKEIAEQLSISYHTVDNHERNIFRKMNIHTRSGAVAKALIEKIC